METGTRNSHAATGSCQGRPPPEAKNASLHQKATSGTAHDRDTHGHATLVQSTAVLSPPGLFRAQSPRNSARDDAQGSHAAPVIGGVSPTPHVMDIVFCTVPKLRRKLDCWGGRQFDVTFLPYSLRRQVAISRKKKWAHLFIVIVSSSSSLRSLGSRFSSLSLSLALVMVGRPLLPQVCG